MSDTPTPAAPLALSPTETTPDRIAQFATAVGKEEATIRTALATLVGDGPDVLELLADPASVTDDDLKGVLVTGEVRIPLAVFRKNLAKLRGAVTLNGVSPAMATFSILPVVPNDDSFLESLRIGGVLKTDPVNVLTAIKAAVAEKLNLYGLPKRLLEKIEEVAIEQEEAVPQQFYALRKLLARRNYADVLEAIGVDGAFVTDGRKRDFLDKIEPLWPTLAGFHEQLTGWQQAWASGMANPGLLLAAFAGQAGGAIMPPGMMQPPDTSVLRSAAEGVIDKINKAFAGVGVAIARALAADALRVHEVLKDETLPATVGAANREQMLKMLGAGVSSDIVRMEKGITGYALAVMELPKVPAGSKEYAYLGEMLQLGATIPWAQLTASGGAPASGIGGGRGGRGTRI